jgi:prolyl oligopeptidase
VELEKRAPSRREFITTKNNGLQNQSVLYRRCQTERDPTPFQRRNHITWRIGFSKDGSKVAYAISEGGIGEK